jgi:hypothetical protein
MIISDLPPTTAEEAAQRAAAEAAQQRAVLEQLISDRIRDAVDARQQSGIEQIWLEDEDQYNGIDDVAVVPNQHPFRSERVQQQDSTGVRSRFYLNITKPKTDTAIARVSEMLLPHDDRPWEVAPTPIPELAQAIEQGDRTMLVLGDGTQAPAVDVARAAAAKADRAAEIAGTQIEDWLVECDAYGAMRKVIRDAGRLGSGVLKGPVPVLSRAKRWTVQDGVPVLVAAERVQPGSRRISPWDLFPDPSCGEYLHDGAFIAERDYVTARRLRELAKLPDYDQAALVEIIKDGPRKRSRFDDRDTREGPGQTSTLASETFEVWYYYGDIPPEQLIAGGFVVVGLNDAADPAVLAAQVDQALQLATVPVVATVINDRIVRVTLNPLETGAFPFDVFVWEPVDGQIWGRGVPRKMQVAQRGLNSAVRAMLENAGMSSGPQVVIDRSRVVPANGRYEITGRKLWYWQPGDEVKDVRFAFQSVQIQSAQGELQAIIDFFLRMADELSSLPLLLQGIVGSQAPETLGGQAMAVANATSPLRLIAKQFDDLLVAPHLKRYYDWLMQDPNVKPEAKGDLLCRARGSSVLVYRDIAAQFLPQLAPLVADPRYGIDPQRWVTEVLRGAKIQPSSVRYSEEEQKALQAKLAEQGQPVDPRVQAAQIRAQADAQAVQADAQIKQAEMQFRAQEHAADRELQRFVKQIELQIQTLELAGQREMSIEQIKAMLAGKALDLRTKRDLQQNELLFARTQGGGRGI